MTDAPPETLLVRHIRAHVRQGEKAKERADQARKKTEQHFVAAGIYLTTLKVNYAPTWQQWETILKVKVHLSTGRASELMQIASGKKSLQEIRDNDAEKHRRLRQSSSGQPQCPEENEEPSDEPNAGSKTLAPTPTPVIAQDGQAQAFTLIDALVASSSSSRSAAVDLLVNGSPDQFERATIATADIYQGLARAGR